MTSWLISLSQSLFGHSAFAVRLPSLLLNSATWLMLWSLAEEMHGARAARVTFYLYLLVPIFSLGGLMMVPDIPMGLCWTYLMLLAWRATSSQEISWPLIAVIVGLGILSKYTMVLSAASLLIFFFSIPSLRSQIMTRNFFKGIGILLLFSIPILIWNVQNGWPSLYYHLYERQSSNGVNFSQWGRFWISQMAFLTPMIFIGICIALFNGVQRWNDLKWRWTFCFSAPTLLLFSVQALFSEFKPHWPAPAYLPLLIACGALWDRLLRAQSIFFRNRTKPILIATFTLIFLLPFNLFFYIETIYPLAPKIHRFFSTKKWDPKWDPTNDLYGWKEISELLLERRAYFEERGLNPIIASYRYQLVAPLRFHLKQPIWSLSDITDQYDFVDAPATSSSPNGRYTLFVTDNRFSANPTDALKLESCELDRTLPIYRRTELARTFQIWICKIPNSFVDESDRKPHQNSHGNG